MNKMDQKVLAVKTERLFVEGVWEGFKRAEDLKGILSVITSEGECLRRGDLEEDESYKQIIAQIVLIVGNELFIHRIPATGSEERLHDMWPIFLGGHIDDSDAGIDEAMRREFAEEIDYRGNAISQKFIGMVNLQDNPVNRVHVGLVFVFRGDTKEVKDTGDRGIDKGMFVTWEEAEKLKDKMTYWSKLAFPILKKEYGS